MTRRSTHRHGVVVKNVRDPVSGDDGRRILVDRLWPRGVSKDRARLTEWWRDLSPTRELRQWFAHDPARWDDFRRRYRRELEGRGQIELLQALRDGSATERVTLLYAANDHEHNNAVALLEFIEAL